MVKFLNGKNFIIGKRSKELKVKAIVFESKSRTFIARMHWMGGLKS